MVTLIVMDGLGVSKEKLGNAVQLQGMPSFEKLKKQYPYTQLNSSGVFVGLNEGQMGNSEVGHLNLGAGRVVLQDLPRINKAIEDKSFFENEALLKTLEHCRKNYSNLHIMGLCSDGGVHSHINHLKALIDVASKKKVHTFLHLFLDGRDTAVNSGVKYVNEIKDYCAGKTCRIATLCGRAFAMDREKRFDRIQKVYKMLTFGRAEKLENNIDDAFANSYEKEIYDEFFRTTIINGNYSSIKDGDAVIFFNFRADRARELTDAFTKEDFEEFKVNKYKNLCFTTFTEYDSENKNVNVMFEPVKIENNLSKIIADNNLKQLHIAETTKYAHVTFFFNGGIEKENVNEDRKLIESENVLDFSCVPKMKAFEITEEVLLAICDQKYDFILVNLCNADMIGHTGNFEATVKAVEAVDKCAYAIALACLSAGGDCIITADHGNAESMVDKAGNKITSHTTNKVPFLLVSNKHKKTKLIKKGNLSNVAPTVLDLLGIEIPEEMDESLIKQKKKKVNKQ